MIDIDSDQVTAEAEETTLDKMVPSNKTLAGKMAHIVGSMEGIKRDHNGRYPAHSIDQIVTAVRPLTSANALRIKTEVLDIEPFAVLRSMPFWSERDGRTEKYERDVHLFRMHLLFTIVNATTRETDQHRWTHVFEIGKAEQDQSCGAAISYATKDFLKREFMIADDSDDPDYKSSGGSSGGGQHQKQDLTALDGQSLSIDKLVVNENKRSDRSPSSYAQSDSGEISIALWDNTLTHIDSMFNLRDGSFSGRIAKGMPVQFPAPLHLCVSANQYGLNLAAVNKQDSSISNPALQAQFMINAKAIIPDLDVAGAAALLDVPSLDGCEATIAEAIEVIMIANNVGAGGSAPATAPVSGRSAPSGPTSAEFDDDDLWDMPPE